MKSLTKRIYGSALALGLSSVLVIACDGGGSGVSSDKSVNQVTLDEATSICESTMGTAQQALVTIQCYGAAVQNNPSDPTACETAAQDCIANPPQEQQGDDFNCELGQADLDDLAACPDELTVGEFEDCLGAQAADIQAYADELSCSNMPAFPELPPTCQPVQEKCPGLIDG